jgi:hypothetical protein
LFSQYQLFAGAVKHSKSAPALFSHVLTASSQSDNGYWTPSPTYWTPTTYYPPTTAYTSWWTPLTVYTTCYTQNEVIVTITSTIPCPVTSTVIYYTYECNECQCTDCCEDCCDGSPSCCNYDHCYGYGTTTETQYTTTTPYPVETITSNGYVVVVMDTGSYVQSLGATDQVQIVSQATASVQPVSTSAFWVSMAGVLIVGGLMLAL